MQNIFNRLNHTYKIFSRSNWKTVKSILDKTALDKFSPVLSLDLTEKCNFNCSFCVDKSVVKKNKAYELIWKDLKNFLYEIYLRECRALEITGGGEPTLYSNFVDFISVASDIGFKLGMITNGSKLIDYSEAINNANFDWIRISLNSACEQTHKRFHGIDRNVFSRIVNGIEKISKNTTTGISFIIDEMNYMEIYDCVKLAESIGVKYCEFKPKILNRRFINYKSMNQYIREQLLLASDTNISIIAPNSLKYIINQDIINQEETFNEKKCHTCFVSYFRTLLAPSGVYVCPYMRGSKQKIICELNAEAIIGARNNLINNIDPSVVCSNYCTRYEINNVIEMLSNIVVHYPSILDYMGWPIDVGEDVIWI